MLELFKKKPADPRKELKGILGDCELPSFPAIVTTVLERVRDPDSATAEIADLMSSDPGLSVRLLGTVNSAAFALRHEVRNIHHAVSLLGRNQLESMLISMAVGQTLPRQAATGYDVARFWTTSAQRATTARALSGLLDPSTSSESFTAGLLQDLAAFLLLQRRFRIRDVLGRDLHVFFLFSPEYGDDAAEPLLPLLPADEIQGLGHGNAVNPRGEPCIAPEPVQ